MSSKVTGWVWDQELLVQRKCVLLWLAERATDNGVCFPGQAEIRAKTGLSESMVRRYLHWLAADQDETGHPKRPLVRIIQRRVAGARNTSNVYVLLVPWADEAAVQRDLQELKHMPETEAADEAQGLGCTGAPQGGEQVMTPVGVAGAPQVGGAGDTEEPFVPEPDREYSPLPPSGQQQGVERGSVSGTGEHDAPEIRRQPERHDAAVALVEAFYTGLGSDTRSTTAPLRRRDLIIAQQLVDVGATADEALAYACEMASAAARLAPVDLRSFERERIGWLARRRAGGRQAGAFIDRTGQPPSWQTALPEAMSDEATHPAGGDGLAPPGGNSAAGEDSFRQALKDALNRSRA
jgi:hypothetical protein